MHSGDKSKDNPPFASALLVSKLPQATPETLEGIPKTDRTREPNRTRVFKRLGVSGWGVFSPMPPAENFLLKVPFQERCFSPGPSALSKSPTSVATPHGAVNSDFNIPLLRHHPLYLCLSRIIPFCEFLGFFGLFCLKRTFFEKMRASPSPYIT